MADPLIRATIEHRIPGRVRLRISGRRGDAIFFSCAVAVLSGWQGVHTVQANPLTGSILVHHTGEPASWLSRAKAEGLFEAAEPGREVAVRAGPAGAKRPVPSPLDIAAAGLAAAGVLQLARGQMIGPASESPWNAYGLWVVTRRPWAPAALCALGLLQLARG